MVNMEEIDLSDRRGLIAMAYGPGTEHFKSASSSTLAAASDKAPLKENKQNKKNEEKEKKSSRVSCAPATVCLLLLCSVFCCLLSALISYGLTKQAFDRTHDVENFVPDPRYNISQEQPLEDVEDMGDDGPSAEELRLPHTAQPIWYNLTVQTYLPGFVDIPKEKNLTFAASLTIKIRFVEATDEIVLNAIGLRFPEEDTRYRIMVDSAQRFRRDTNATDVDEESAAANGTELATASSGDQSTTQSTTVETSTEGSTVGQETTERSNAVPVLPTGPFDSGIKVVEVKVNETLEKVTFKLSKGVSAGQEIYFKLSYNGKIRDSLNGLYQSTYKKPDGTQRVMAVTHMEATDARRFVPCFDEPQLKAVWRVKVIHPRGSKAVSNAIEEKENVPMKGSADWVATSFAETLPISSYLIALSVNDFEYSEGKTERGTRFRVWARPSALNQTQYALSVGTKVLEYYEKFYGIPFPMPKQDMIALPDFEAGAMENMGLVTYREGYLLYDQKLYSLSDKKDVAMVVAHELAHQWFGDLVTMKWWDDLWLNEGFATFMELLGTDAVSNEDFRMNEMFVVDSQWKALVKDSKSTSHPLSFNITKAFEVDDAFDSISYDKGAAVLTMLEAVLGEQNFRKGLNIYLNEHKYANAEAADLWKALDQAKPEQLTSWDGKRFDVADFAQKWTKQMGYPVVEVYRIDTKTVELTQKRFKTDALTPEKAKYRNAPFWYKWDIPLWFSVDGESKPMQWLHEAYRFNLSESELLIVNPDSVGFYRVNYNQRGWEAIQRQLDADHTKIPTKARARLIDDAFALAEANQLPYEVAFNVSAYLAKEEELLPWLSALRGLEHAKKLFGDEPDSEGIRTFVQKRLEPLFAKIDFEKLDFAKDNQLFESILVGQAVAQFCALRVQNCTEKLAKLFENDLLGACADGQVASECSKVPVEIRDSVYCEGVLSGTEKTFDRVKQLYAAEPVAVERSRLLEALGCSRDTYTLKRLLASAVDKNDTTIRQQDVGSVFATVAENPVGEKIIFDFIQDNWKDISEAYSDTAFMLRNIVHQGIDLKTDRKIKELEHFLSSHRASTRRVEAFQRVLERARSNANWTANHRKHLIAYFDQQNKPKTEL